MNNINYSVNYISQLYKDGSGCVSAGSNEVSTVFY